MGLLSAIGGIAGIAGAATGQPWLTAAGSALGALGNQQYQSEEAQVNRDFQANMANTSYQRRVEDLKAAGLSPMLAYSQGGAAVPSGAQGSSAANVGEAAASTGSTARQINLNREQVISQVELQEAQKGLVGAQAMDADASAQLKRAQTLNTLLQNDHIPEQIKNTIMHTQLMRTQAGVQIATAKNMNYLMPQSQKIGAAWASDLGTASAYGKLVKENTPNVGVNAGKLGSFGLNVR